MKNNLLLATMEPLEVPCRCLAKDTLVRMADGSQKTIESIRIGDRVFNPYLGQLVVNNIWRGHEDELVVLESVDHDYKLRITPEHPIETERGILRAREISISDHIKTEQGQFVQFESVSIETYDDIVYNLSLDQENHMFVANGIVVGDFECQNNNW